MDFLFLFLVVHVLDFSTLVSLRNFLAFSRQIFVSAVLYSPLWASRFGLLLHVSLGLFSAFAIL